MRGWIAAALVTLAACPAPAPPQAPAPKGPTACERASDNLVQAMVARLPRADPVPTETADALRNLIRERCEQDAWSDDATRCLIAMKRTEDAGPCAQLMTEAQQAALVRDEEALFGNPSRPASPPAEPAPAPAPASSDGTPPKN